MKRDNPSTEPLPADKKKFIKPEEDGRNKEWEDRARVNLEQIPEGVKTNAERDFEPETLPGGENKTEEDTPAY